MTAWLLSSETGNQSVDLSISHKKRELKSGPWPRCVSTTASHSFLVVFSIFADYEEGDVQCCRCCCECSLLRRERIAGRVQEGEVVSTAAEGKERCLASPGATGTHTTPLAFPRDRQTDRPIRGLVGGERYPATCSR